MQNLIQITNVLGPIGTNCYTVVNTDTREAAIVDPAARGDFLKNLYDNQNIHPVAILLTHGHADHIGAVDQLRKLYPEIKVYAAKEEQALLADPMKNLSEMFGQAYSVSADVWLSDGEEIDLLGTKVRCILTPGHTAGGMCFYFGENKMLYAGDTIFFESIGRTDYPTGDESALGESIREKIFTLPEDTVIYTGHYAKTTVGHEKENNPYVEFL